MPWVRFWADANCPSGISSPESTYSYFDRPLDEVKNAEELKDMAEENIPSWMQGSERGCRYGWEILEVLPEPVRLNLIKGYERQKAYANRMIAILEGRPIPKPRKPKPVPKLKPPKSRLKRVG